MGAPSTRSGRTCRSAGSSSSSRSSSTCTRGRARSSSRSARGGIRRPRSRTAPGFAGFAAGEIGQVPSDPDIAAIPDLASYTPVPVAAEPRPLRLRRHGRGRGVAVLPAHDPAPRARAAPREGLRVQDGPRARVLPRHAARRRLDRDRRSATTRSRSPATTWPGLTRRYDFLTTVSRYCNELGWGNYANDHEDANGQFEQNFTYDDALVELRPRDLLPLHGAHARRAERDDRDVHAEAVHAPDRQRLPLPHVALGRRHEPLPRRGRPARARALGARVPLHRRAEDARARVQRAHRADGQLVQAAQGRDDVERRDLVAGLDLVRLQQPHADAPDPGPGPRSRTGRSTAPATRTSRRPRCSRPASTGSSARLDAGEPNSENLYALPYDELSARGLETLPANLLEAIGRARAGRRPPRGARPRPRRGLRRLLRPREARGVDPLPRAGHALGDPGVPDAVLRYGGNLHTRE